MRIGTMRAEESEAFGDYAGYHRFVGDDGSPYGSFEIFFHRGGHMVDQDPDDGMPLDDWRDPEPPGWYWLACFPGCLPDGDSVGPFSTSMDAYYDAIEE